jgi:hypothetical protein
VVGRHDCSTQATELRRSDRYPHFVAADLSWRASVERFTHCWVQIATQTLHFLDAIFTFLLYTVE